MAKSWGGKSALISGLMLAGVLMLASAAHAGPNKPFRGLGEGTLTGWTNDVCGGTDFACVNDPANCFCWEVSSSLQGVGIGNGSIAVQLLQDDSLYDGVCGPTSGIGTITAANGATANIKVAGQLCGTEGFEYSTFDLTYVVDGGTGKLTSADGTGTANITVNNTDCTGGDTGCSAQVTLYGDLQK
jgi:hypothetical protein